MNLPNGCDVLAGRKPFGANDRHPGGRCRQYDIRASHGGVGSDDACDGDVESSRHPERTRRRSRRSACHSTELCSAEPQAGSARSVTSTSTSPRFGRRKASSTCSWPSIARPSSPSSSCTRRPPRASRPASYRHLPEALPYKVHTVLTDNGIQFTTPGAGGSAVPEIREALANGELFRPHAFELACARAGIDHRTAKPKQPWTNGQSLPPRRRGSSD